MGSGTSIAGNQLIASDRFLETALHIAHLFLRKEEEADFDMEKVLDLAQASLKKIAASLTIAGKFRTSSTEYFSELTKEILASRDSLNEMLAAFSTGKDAA